MSRQLTLALLKADVASMPHKITQVNQILIKNDLKILQRKRFEVSSKTSQIIENFYSEHEGKFFHRRLVEYMKSGPFEALVLGSNHSDAIDEWRGLIGPAKIYANQDQESNKMRNLHGISDTRNGFHGSDSPDSTKSEMSKLGFNYKKILSEYQTALDHNNQFIFVPELQIHLPSVGNNKNGFCKNVSQTLGLLSTWDRVYGSGRAPEEWFVTSKLNETVFNMVEDYVEKSQRKNSDSEKIEKIDYFFDIGCGTSNFCEDLATKFSNSQVIASDFSKVAIESRKSEDSENKKIKNLSFHQHDLTENIELLTSQIENFDENSSIGIIDKATIDAIIRQPNGEKIGKKVFEELLRLRNWWSKKIVKKIFKNFLFLTLNITYNITITPIKTPLN